MHNPHISLCQKDELVCIQVDHPRATALVALQGAQLLEYKPADSHPLIWLSELAEFKQGQSVRGGIPVCWPWFGDARRNPQAVQQHLPEGELPAHGWVRTQPWLLESASSDDAGVFLRLKLPDIELPPPFPKGIELKLEMSIGRELELKLITANRSDQPLCLSQALHTYFPVSDVANVEIHNLERVRFIDTLDNWSEKTEDAPIGIIDETDRIYLNTPEVIQIEDSGWGRQIKICAEHSKSAVVWNPWIDKSKQLSQFADDAYRNMVCVETANVVEDCLVIEPGDSGLLGLVLVGTD